MRTSAKVTRRRTLVPVGVALLVALAAAACSSASSSSTSSPSTGSSSSAAGLIPIRFQLSWTPEAEFAGYLVAKAEGYYQQAGLNVSILSGGPNINDVQQLVSGAADLAVDRTSTLFQAVAKGIPIKAIAETDSVPQIWLVGWKKDGITSVASLKGQRIGIYSDDAFIVDTMLKHMGISLSQVHVFFQGFNVNPFIANKYPVAEVYLTSDLESIQFAGIKTSELTIFKPADYGANIIHGVIMGTDKIIQSDPAALTKFVQATLKGWEYAYTHPYQAISIVLQAAGPSGGTRAYQTAGLMAMKAIQWPTGVAPPNWGQIPLSVYQQNAQVVTSNGVVTSPINVAADVDTSIAGGNG
jgi:NitT/TauT family transport system substrate-binding protein